MRINEILGMRIKDVEGVQASSIWIRPYRAKHQQHLLKTDSAERNLNVQILLTKEEHLKFQQYCTHAVALIHPMTIYLHFGIAQNVSNPTWSPRLFKSYLMQFCQIIVIAFTR
jgi:hypothetical protein